VSVLRDLLAGKAVSTPQPLTQSASRAPRITGADSVIDPTAMTAEDIARRHRAISHQRPLIVYLPTRKALQLHSPSVYSAPAPTDDVLLPTIPGTAIYYPPTRTLLVRCASNSTSCSLSGSDSGSSGSISALPSPGSILSVPRVKQEGRALLAAKEWWNGAKGTGMGIVQGGVVRLSGT